MEGLYFYWLSWMCWIWATFLMRKQKQERIKIAAWVLAVIIAVNYKATIFIYDFNGSALIIVLLLVFETRKTKASEFLYLFITSFIIMLSYASFLLLELYDPVWVIIDSKILIAAGILYLTVVLHKNKKNRLLISITGLLLGEVIFATVLANQGISYFISSLAFLDLMFICLGLQQVWNAIQTTIEAISKNSLNQMEGEKQKTS